MTATIPRKKLIEVSIPLEAINVASAREKSIRHGHPSTLHLWWARRPLAACRAVLFAQLVDDPSSWPDRFPTDEAQDIERRRLHRVIEDMVPWEASNNDAVLNAARWEIARSVAWGLLEEPPPQGDSEAVLSYLQTKAPPVYDPFSGGGSIPLEAQRLGLRAYGSDLNPVATLISKALVEIPPKFSCHQPVNPEAREDAKHGQLRSWKASQGLAEDVRYYGQRLRERVAHDIAHLYPKVKMPDGSDGTVIAWLWARTVRSPDPSASGAKVPLVSSFMLSTKERKKAWVTPILDPNAPDGWRFETSMGQLSKDDEARLKSGTKTTRGNFYCLLTGAPITDEYSRAQGMAGQIGHRMIAIIAEGERGRFFLTPSLADESAADTPRPSVAPEGELFGKALGFRVPAYGMTRWGDLFTNRQLTVLNCFSENLKVIHDLVAESSAGQFSDDNEGIEEGGLGGRAYADAVTTYLAFLIDQMTNHSSLLCGWNSANTQMRSVFSRQALSMTWDYAEVNLLSDSSGSFTNLFDRMVKGFSGLSPTAGDASIQMAMAQSAPIMEGSVVSTDPPYYDNIGYADLSDFFYSWLRPNLIHIWPALFRRILTPKDEELVATPHRHGGTAAAHNFFMSGMGEALSNMRRAASTSAPITIFYAFKQSETTHEGTSSAGWASFLQAVVDSGLLVDGTWPLDTEKKGRVRDIGTNALASSIVLVCRKRASNASIITRADFIRALKREMPDAIDDIRKAGVGPVDMQQSVIGPGMGVFSRHAKVLEDDDSAMPVRTALTLINRVWEEIDQELDAAFDAETQVALAWFATYGFDARQSGELITLANAKNISTNALFDCGVFKDLRGKTALTPREELPKGWTPANDKSLTVWECVQHTARALNAEDGGGAAAGRFVREMGLKAAEARTLAYRLFEIATQKGWAAEALIYNELAQEWPKLEDLAAKDAHSGEQKLKQAKFL